MATFDERIDGWRDTLRHAENQNRSRMTPEQVEIAIALIQMLNQNQPDVWNIDACDQMVARFVTEITDNGTKNIDGIMINMASQANASIGDEYLLNVEWYRNLFVKIFATTTTASVTYLILQAYFPGALSYALDSAYALFEFLRSQGVSEIRIAAEASATDHTPFSAGPFASAAAQASLNLAKAALYACIAVAGTCIQAGVQVASNVVPECLKYGSQLLAITLITKVARKVTDTAVSMGTAAYGVATGSADEQIAQFFREGGPGKLKAAASNAVSSAADAAVDFTKEALFNGLEAINNIMNDRPFDINNPASRYMININDDILYWLDEYIRKFSTQDEITVFLGKLIEKLSEINFEQTEKKIDKQIQEIANYFEIELENKGFRSLITVYRLASDKKDIVEEIASQPESGATYRGIEQKDMTRTVSLPSGYLYPEGDNPKVTKHELKTYKPIGPDRPFEFNPSKLSEPQLKKMNTKLENRLEKLKLKATIFPRVSMFRGRDVYNVLLQYPNDVQGRIADKLSKMPEKSIITGSSKEDMKNNTKNKVNFMMEIENFLREYENQSKDKIEQNQEEYIKLNQNPNFYVEEIAMEEGGSRRRPRKSRRYKKKRSTLKRRQMKRRRTRKGKKRRYTRKH
jgi:hypothetical protein